MNTKASINNVSANIAPMMVHRQSVHLRSFSMLRTGSTFDGKLAEGVQFLLEHRQVNIIMEAKTLF